jgi:hypothetical protein
MSLMQWQLRISALAIRLCELELELGLLRMSQRFDSILKFCNVLCGMFSLVFRVLYAVLIGVEVVLEPQDH